MFDMTFAFRSLCFASSPLQVKVSLDPIRVYVHCIWCVFTRALDDCLKMGQTQVCPSCSAGEWVDAWDDGWMFRSVHCWVGRVKIVDACVDGWMVVRIFGCKGG